MTRRKVQRPPLLAGVMLACALARFGAAAELQSLRAVGLEVRYHASDHAMADQAAAVVNDSLQQMRNRLQIDLRAPVEVILARGPDEFHQWAGGAVPEWALAIARTGESRVVIDVARTEGVLSNSLLLTLRHELLHLALGQAERSAHVSLPLWFHEGVAVGLSGARWDQDQRPLLEAGNAGRLIPLDDLSDSFPADATRAQLAYLEAEDFVRFVTQRGGPDTLGRLIQELRAAGSLDAAILDALGESRSDLEAEWAAGFHVGHPFLRLLLRHVSLFSVLAVLTIAIFLLVRHRYRQRLRLMDREEARYRRPDDEDDKPREPDEDDEVSDDDDDEWEDEEEDGDDTWY